MARRVDWEKAARRTKVWQEREKERRENNPVPSTRMPPTTPAEGRKLFGDCPNCGGSRWWNNKARKNLGFYKQTAPDAVCAGCNYKIWPAGGSLAQ